MKIIKNKNKFVIGEYLYKDEYEKYAKDHGLTAINLTQMNSQEKDDVFSFLKETMQNGIFECLPSYYYNGIAGQGDCHALFHDCIVINESNVFVLYGKRSFSEDCQFLSIYIR